MLFVKLLRLVLPAVFLLSVNAAYASGTSGLACSAQDVDLGSYDHTQKAHEVNFAKTDHFALVFSWSPEFCAYQKKKNGGIIPKHLKFQCDSGIDFGWVVHGLWGQSSKGLSGGKDGGHPRYCTNTDLAKIPESTIRKYMCMSPGAGLLQGEWEKHGACDFSTVDAYFQATQKLASSLVLPPFSMKKAEMHTWMKASNPALADVQLGWLDSSREFAVCYDKQLNISDCK